MISLEYGIDTSWLDVGPEDELFNPMDFVFKDTDSESRIERLCYLMSQPEYFYFTCKYVLNVELLPFQMVMLQELWNKKYPMIIASRGASKSFTMAVYCMLRALLIPKRKVIVVGAAFRQSKVIFGYMETIWRDAPVFRDLCDSNSGPVHGVDSYVMNVNSSSITCLPLGDGQKIRGQRAHDIIADEFASIPRDIFEQVVAGFTTVASNLVNKVKKKARQALMQETMPDSAEDLFKDNQIVLAGTAYYDFNHFAAYWKEHRNWLYTQGDKKRLEELLGGPVKKGFKWDDYSILRVPVNLLPDGMMDDGIVARAEATVHSGIYDMEYGAIFTSDSQGFFKRTLIESCVCSHDRTIKLPSGEVFFEAKLFGDKEKRYVYGVDPASEVDHFSIVILEKHSDHRRIVYCWTTNRQEHKDKVKYHLTTETDFYSYCARKIRDLMKVFPADEIAMDAQGGGIAVMEALHDKDKIQEGEHPIWPIIEEKEKDTDDMPGLHLLNMCQFSRYEWLSEANHGMRKDFEDKVLLFPFFDTISLGIASELDSISGTMYDTLEDCVMDIEELKRELSLIEITQSPSGREKWDTPSSKIGVGKVERLRKDRYSALLMANMSARRQYLPSPFDGYSVVGGFAQLMDKDAEQTRDLYDGPAWWTSNISDIF
jgi:hypothetical protein